MKFIYFYGHTENKDDPLKKHVFSQWYPAKFKDEEGNEYHSAEQYMMAQKALLFLNESIKKNMKIFKEIMKETTDQKKIKKLGRTVYGFDGKTWDKDKLSIVIKGNLLKFSQNEELKKILLATGKDGLAEASPWDNVWGIGLTVNKAIEGAEWKGENLLGEALMAVRNKLTDELKDESSDKLKNKSSDKLEYTISDKLKDKLKDKSKDESSVKSSIKAKDE